MKTRAILVIFIIYAFVDVNAQETFFQKITPDHLKIQFAGNIGVLSAGAGYSFLDGKIMTDVLYGYVPASLGGVNIHTIAGKNTFRLIQQPFLKNVTLTHSIGFSLNYAMTNNTFLFLPGRYPKDYYSPNALHVAPFFAYDFLYINENMKLFNKVNIYFELSTLDTYLWNYVRTNAIDFTDIWNLAIGATIPLIKKTGVSD